MPLTFLGKDTIDGGSPTLYDHGDTWVIQGYIPINLAAIAHFDLGDHETLIEVPRTLMDYLPEGERMRLGSPLVYVAGDMYVVRGPNVTDPAVLAQLEMPPHETVIEVPKTDLSEVIGGLERRGANV
jgi:hypothetical protein